MIEKCHPLTLFKVHWFDSYKGVYVSLDGLRTAAWVQLCRFLNKNISIITTPFSKFPLIRF